MMGEPGTLGAGMDDAGQTGAATDEAKSVVEPDSDGLVSEENSRKSPWNRRVALIGGVAVLIAAAIVLPPLINIGRYQHSITALMTRSMGRPVRMSSVELRLLPRPGFVLHDLSVSEDPGFGAEPILSARVVVASIRILSLWRGRVEIDRVSVDDASLNLVRSAEGRWNLDSLVMGARPALNGDTAVPGRKGMLAPGTPAHFPYLEATESRVNLKNGVEKSPYSLVGTDLSLWQDEPGEWRVRLRGQPVRTDMEMSLADTGEVRMEASLHSAAQLRDMPLKLQIEWREAQLGQLSRLLFGSDAGWRGGVTADIDVQGTPDSAQTKARLRATGVRREEFAPETPLDFDANCGFRYQHSQTAAHDIDCNTAIGGGRLHLKGDLPGNGGEPEALLEVSQVPLQAGLDLLRTVRSGFAPGISAKGTASGSLTYKEVFADDAAPKKPVSHKAHKLARTEAAALPANLHGALTVDGGQLKGGGLKEPLSLPKITMAPVLLADSARSPGGNTASSTGLGARFTILLAPATPAPAPASATSPQGTPASGTSVPAVVTPPQAITVRLGIGARGYDAMFTGSAATTRIRDLVYAFGLPHLEAADGFGEGTGEIDFTAAGPWIASSDSIAATQSATTAVSSDGAVAKSAATTEPVLSRRQDAISGSVQWRHLQWRAAYLARPVELTQAMFTASPARIAFTSDFSYGGTKVTGRDLTRDVTKASGAEPIKGSVVVNVFPNCRVAGEAAVPSPPGAKAGGCEPQVAIHFGAVDAAVLQATLIGTGEEKGLFSPLMDRMRSTDKPKWPEIAVNVQAESLVLGSATLQKPVIQMQFKTDEVVLESWEAALLGGQAKGTGHFAWTGGKPEYTFDGSFMRLNAAEAGALMKVEWTGGPVSGNGHLKLSGIAEKDLTSSTTGELHFDWLHGAMTMAPPAGASGQETKFDDWNGTATIQGGKAQIGQNEMRLGKHTLSVAGLVPLGGPVKLTLALAGTKLTARAGEPDSSPAVK